MKRRNADCSKIRRLPKRSKITEGFYGRYNFSIFNMAAILIIILKEWILFLLSGPFLYWFVSVARENPLDDKFYNVDCKRWRLLTVYVNEEMNRRLFLDVCEHKCLFTVSAVYYLIGEVTELIKKQRINYEYIYILLFKSLLMPCELTFTFTAKNVSVLLSDWISDYFEVIYNYILLIISQQLLINNLNWWTGSFKQFMCSFLVITMGTAQNTWHNSIFKPYYKIGLGFSRQFKIDGLL